MTQAPWLHLIDAPRPLALLVENSQLYEIDDELHRELRAGSPQAHAQLRALRRAPPPLSPAQADPVSLSLNVAQSCNLACHYCYADEGRFHAPARLMPEEVAYKAIAQAIAGAGGRRVTIGFIGGEPFLHRELLHSAVAYARARAAEQGATVGFSVATNATLLRDDDIALLRDNGFSVSVSLDGGAATHDRHRPRRDGRGSYAAALSALAPLLADPGGARVAARVTVTRDDLRVVERMEPLFDAGLREVGVSPARTGPDASLLFGAQDWGPYLDEMTRAGERELTNIRRGGEPRFSNLAIALKEIHRGAAKSLPCGAAQSYVSVGAEGGYYTCHRTIGREGFGLGDVDSGLDNAARRAFLAPRAVDLQAPCSTCWARYLCGGGCHAEVTLAGREGCDFIRGWLEFALVAYNRLSDERPDYFVAGGPR